MSCSQEDSKEYWAQQKPTIQGMLLNPNAEQIDREDQREILAALPDWHDLRVLELAAGIGRFTTSLAQGAKEVVAVDFTESFIEQNRVENQHNDYVTLLCNNVMELDFAPASFDLVFSNWLFMYLVDDDILTLSERMQHWLAPNGWLFFRESCITNSKGELSKGNGNISSYRSPKFYEDIFLKQFEMKRAGFVSIYSEIYHHENQKYWLFQKTD